MNLTSILYAIGFTAGWILCAFFGWSDDSSVLRNLSMMFSGFCLGGVVTILIESSDL